MNIVFIIICQSSGCRSSGCRSSGCRLSGCRSSGCRSSGCRSSRCRSSGLSVKWRVGQVAVGQVGVGQVAVGQVSATPLNRHSFSMQAKKSIFRPPPLLTFLSIGAYDFQRHFQTSSHLMRTYLMGTTYSFLKISIMQS